MFVWHRVLHQGLIENYKLLCVNGTARCSVTFMHTPCKHITLDYRFHSDCFGLGWFYFSLRLMHCLFMWKSWFKPRGHTKFRAYMWLHMCERGRGQRECFFVLVLSHREHTYWSLICERWHSLKTCMITDWHILVTVSSILETNKVIWIYSYSSLSGIHLSVFSTF